MSSKAKNRSFIRAGIDLFASLKLAVFVLLGLSAALATGTILESIYDTPTAQYYVYRSLGFHAILVLLGVNILSVMVSRYPWKPRHTPFILAHIGILTLLAGSLATERFGLDGMMRVTERQTSSVVELDNPQLVIVDQSKVTRVSVPWIPPWVAFRKIPLKERRLPFDVTVDRYITHAEAEYSYLPRDHDPSLKQSQAALQLRIQGGPMQITQDLWLFSGLPSKRTVEMGPAELVIGASSSAQGRPSFSVLPESDGGLSYIAKSSEGKVLSAKLAPSEINGKVLDPGWKGGVKLTLLSYLPEAQPVLAVQPSPVDHGTGAPASAIHIISGQGGPGAEMWLLLGQTGVKFNTGGREVEVGYFPQRLMLPFGVRLEHFEIEHYHGTQDPSEYSSKVSVVGSGQPRQVTISMNEPMTEAGITLYQTSFDDVKPRPVTSIFSVNRDPGRMLKYYGSLLIVLGTILLFAVKYLKSKSPV